jgi:hypothetical protein
MKNALRPFAVLMCLIAFPLFAAEHAAAPKLDFPSGSPLTTNNDNSCDIGVYPAATLLLPYFENDMTPVNSGVDTLFTVTNTSRLPQIAHVTLWTDWSYPILDFNLFLTGYDSVSLSTWDIIVGGIIAPNGSTPPGTSSSTPRGLFSAANTGNPLLNLANCTGLPGFIPPQTLFDLRLALTTGQAPSLCGSTRVGSPHTRATGYITIDVTSRCSTSLPNDPTYFLTEILFDNVLTGDYAFLNKDTTTGNFAGGNPLVHIRAIPEGGPAGTPLVGAQTNLPYTFYSRYMNGQGVIPLNYDRRQPLPSVFSAHFIEGGPGGFNTNFKIWREGRTGPTTCNNAVSNSALAITEIIRFDMRENPMTYNNGVIISPSVPQNITLPETSSSSSAGGNYPPNNSGDTSGWMYLNLNSGTTFGPMDNVTHPAFPPPRPSQNWVSINMFAEGRFATEFDATMLANGCTPAAAVNAVTPIGPGPNVTP